MKLGVIGVGITAVLAAILYHKQESLLYFPEIPGIGRNNANNPRGYRSPGERQIPFESHRIPTSDGVKIHAWLVLYDNEPPAATTSKVPTIIFFHGNAGNIGLRIPHAIQMRHYLRANILMVDYRGYGESDSVPRITEEGIRRDAIGAWEFCQRPHPHIDPHSIFVYGDSLGGAVAFALANEIQNRHQQNPDRVPPLAGVIVENTFLSIDKMVDHLFPPLAKVKQFILRLHWDSSAVVPTLQTPALYVAGASDELVPHDHMLKLVQLHRQATDRVVLHVVPDGTHNDTWIRGGPAHWDAFRKFISQAIEWVKLPIRTYSSVTEDQCPDEDESFEKVNIPVMSSNLIDIARGNFASSTAEASADKKKD